MEGVRKGKTKKTRCDEGRAPTCVVSWFKAGGCPENQRCTGCVAGNTFGMYFRRRLSSPSARMMPRMPCAVLRSNRQSFTNSLLVLPKFDKCCLCSFAEIRLRHQIPKQKEKKKNSSDTPAAAVLDMDGCYCYGWILLLPGREGYLREHLRIHHVLLHHVDVNLFKCMTVVPFEEKMRCFGRCTRKCAAMFAKFRKVFYRKRKIRYYTVIAEFRLNHNK